MPIIDIAGLTALNGLAAQLTALTVIVVAFLLLFRVSPFDGVVGVWAAAWVAALLSVAALFIRYLLLPDLDQTELHSSSLLSNTLDLVYQSGKLLHGGLLLIGALMLRGMRPRARVLVLAATTALVYALVSVMTTSDPYGLVQWQIPVMVPLLAATAIALAPGVGPGHDRLMGTAPAAIAAAGLALLWLVYHFAFSRTTTEIPLDYQLGALVQFNSYVDMFGDLALAFALGHVVSRGVQDRLVLLHRELERAHDQLQRVARHDELTGVYNRRAFEELVRDRDWAEAPSLAVAMLDMDNLKEINDERGHAAGDAALAHLAAQLSASVEGAVVIRWGGDEFLCMCTAYDAETLRQRIDGALHDTGPVPGLAGMEIEVSVGTAQREPDEPLASTIGRADRAMYREKYCKRQGVEQRSLWDQ